MFTKATLTKLIPAYRPKADEPKKRPAGGCDLPAKRSKRKTRSPLPVSSRWSKPGTKEICLPLTFSNTRLETFQKTIKRMPLGKLTENCPCPHMDQRRGGLKCQLQRAKLNGRYFANWPCWKCWWNTHKPFKIWSWVMARCGRSGHNWMAMQWKRSNHRSTKTGRYRSQSTNTVLQQTESRRCSHYRGKVFSRRAQQRRHISSLRLCPKTIWSKRHWTDFSNTGPGL